MGQQLDKSSMHGIHIVAAGPEHAEAIAGLSRFLPQMEQVPLHLVQQFISLRLSVVALRWLENGVVEVVGYCIGKVGSLSVPDPAGRPGGYVVSLAVAPSCRRLGVGSALMSVIETAFRRQCHHMSLDVRESNEGAQKLYARHGFHVEHCLPNFYHLPEERGMHMVKRFEPVAAVLAGALGDESEEESLSEEECDDEDEVKPTASRFASFLSHSHPLQTCHEASVVA
eukprot:gnl/TRDRNA2_/TRDRNA2_53722_c0_seq1.p1 gnl/TRDRNA2_/TRDRNA2_53722_c0~~gnl/TRDRNA2_/TRDRNA2_53722_c0_seq1.p1  ORF type:complete len:227 (+),score=43.73 gnl/TRDRNA2_/TRDRNA2_53722_c0_seq1:105-785(+)